MWPIEVLFDDTDGAFDTVLNRTKEIYDKGPLAVYPDGCRERLSKLDRWVGKLEKYQNDPEVYFYYAGIAYESFARVWFERRNLWPLPPAQASPFIKEKDYDFREVLSAFTKANEHDMTIIAQDIANQLLIRIN